MLQGLGDDHDDRTVQVALGQVQTCKVLEAPQDVLGQLDRLGLGVCRRRRGDL